MFQSTHPRGVRPFQYLDQCREGKSFNPRTRVGCDHQKEFAQNGIRWFQSTHPRGVRHQTLTDGSTVTEVSIHAPAWGATAMVAAERDGEHVSIHAPAWGATERHLRNGGLVRVSIHAPAWGATSGRCSAARHTPCFNPRTRVGCDIPCAKMIARSGRFQSTHPRGVRPKDLRPLHDAVFCFNPRTRVGCDGIGVSKRTIISVFQSTHPRGVRPVPTTRIFAAQEFQSTHPRGVRRIVQRFTVL